MKCRVLSFFGVLFIIFAANIVLLPVGLYLWKYPLDRILPEASEYVESLFSCNIPCKLAKHPTLRDKYRPDIPMRLDASNAEPYLSAHAELLEYPYIRMALEHLEVLNKAANINETRYKTCAVVGNSQNLSGSNYGEFIDSHEAVFRMNIAPTRKHEQDVGKKTTLRMFNTAANYRRLYGGQPFEAEAMFQTSAHSNGMKRNDFQKHFSYRTMLLLHDIGKAWFPNAPVKSKQFAHQHKMLTKYLKPKRGENIFSRAPRWDFPTRLRNNLHITHPEFYQHIEKEWFNQKRSNPSIGFFTLVSSLYLCDQVDVFGFGLNKDGKWGHYYEGKLRSAMHKISFQDRFMDMLEKDGIITIYRGAE